DSNDQWKLQRPSQPPCRKISGNRCRRQSAERKILNHYRHFEHQGQFRHTKLILEKKFRKELRGIKGDRKGFIINPHHSEEAERFKHQGWESLKSNPTYEVLLKYKYIVFRDSLPNSTPPIREGIEHEIHLKPGTPPISVRQWRQSPEQSKEIIAWTKEMVKAGVKKPVGWRMVHDYRQLNNATILPASRCLARKTLSTRWPVASIFVYGLFNGLLPSQAEGLLSRQLKFTDSCSGGDDTHPQHWNCLQAPT
ncbi:TPA: hypothetical protein N0F65_000645, partial [Lagenidium giganteum]